MKSAGLTSLARALAALGIAAAAGASAQPPVDDRVILSDEMGRGATLGGNEDLREELPPADVSGPEVAAEFKRLCLDTDFDAAVHAQAALDSDWGFQRREAVLEPLGKNPAVSFVHYRSASAITSLWGGENRKALGSRAYTARLRRGSIIGGISEKDLNAPQCNLSVATRGIADAAPLAAALEQALGRPADKAVLKGTFADGYWKIAEPSGEIRRVSFEVVDLKKAIQILHLTVQTLPAAKP